MAEMGIANAANCFYPIHAMALVAMEVDGIIRNRLRK
jgi:hypothetical protein